MNPTLEITVAVPCKNGCKYCPQGKLTQAYLGEKELSVENYKKVIDKLPKNVRVDFSGFCEPFQNEKAAGMMHYASIKGHNVVLYSTLVGYDRKYNWDIQSTNFVLIMVHLPDIDGGYSHDESEFIKAYDDFRMVINQDQIQYMAMGKVSDFIKKHIPQEKIQYPDMMSRGSNLNCVTHPEIRNGNMRCVISGTDNDHNVMLPNGDVYRCCMDYGLEYKLGNLFTGTYESLNRDFDDDLCRKCEWGEVC
jgi:hypothetical protein